MVKSKGVTRWLQPSKVSIVWCAERPGGTPRCLHSWLGHPMPTPPPGYTLGHTTIRPFDGPITWSNIFQEGIAPGACGLTGDTDTRRPRHTLSTAHSHSRSVCWSRIASQDMSRRASVRMTSSTLFAINCVATTAAAVGVPVAPEPHSAIPEGLSVPVWTAPDPAVKRSYHGATGMVSNPERGFRMEIDNGCDSGGVTAEQVRQSCRQTSLRQMWKACMLVLAPSP
jgi:hypothetical protein